ncbi:aldo/keto reductase [Paenibacillus jilunlii]|uniref:Aldo/keto reductase n=1 Tax=Paenibacillus jilunlii TaxID=682956 RepID=A0A1G9MCX3_9BACL|nr:aldo/keto reductase [Paenibacillus jilunlii]KWX70515.1 aldo/keto reductase [Paenibacillus jilunlii]SDL72130.1 Predicted oxidoreductase [Paenibacillus jilunlii]
MKYRKLGNTGLDVSVLSYGASSLGSVFRDVPKEEGIRTVHTAIDMGINLIDVSPYYGLTKAEMVLGEALRTVPRDRYILSTKAGRYGQDEFDFSKERVIRSAEESMTRLGTDYLDILLLHDIEFGRIGQVMEEGIPALKELKQSGKIRFYGVTGLPLNIFETVLSRTTLDVVLSYCHYSLNDTTLLRLLPLLERQGTGLMNASPISMGLLSSRKVPDWHPAGGDIQAACKRAAEYCRDKGEDIAKLAVQFSTANEQIPTTLVSTATPANIRNNILWTEEPMNEQLLEEVLDILKPVDGATWPSGRAEWNEERNQNGERI